LKKLAIFPGLLLIFIAILFFGFFGKAETPKKEIPPPIQEAILKNLKWRCIGPANMGGRIDDFAVVETNPFIIYVGTASGGVWKTINNGVTWEPIFDDQSTSTIGDVTVTPSNPDIVWVGTGEPNNRQSSSWGDGVFKSEDGGKTWKNMGLRDTHHIGRIGIHPSNPDIVYVAALGRLWGPHQERGLFKTYDGGKTWIKSLYINEDTGVVDVAMDSKNPNVLYAAAYQRRRTPWGFNGGGPGSGLYRTTDGGETWIHLTNGFPEGITGRIGIDIYRSNPNIVYALVEHKDGGVFRSDDKGLTWKRMSNINPRPVYYSKIRVDPNNDQRIWVLGDEMFVSEDGGRTFRTDLIIRTDRSKRRVHGDYHAMWINPSNSDHMVIGSDGGIYFSYDRGKNWDFINTLPLGQVYEISFDMRKPYFVSAGLQDNATWHGPSAAWFRDGITNDEWFRIGGADGFYNQIDPKDYTTIYTESQHGEICRFNLKTGEYKSIKPAPENSQEIYRFNWNSPFLLSPYNPQKIYLGGNRLFISDDRGETWRATMDLTSQLDRDRIPIMGVNINENTLSRHDGVEFFSTITTISESPIKEGLIYVGTDDGKLQISRNGGTTWKNIVQNILGLPKDIYVSRVVASDAEEGTAYATFDGHSENNFKPYVFMTTDYGENWKTISSNLTEGGTVNVIREHPMNADLLFVGTERGAYFSIDRGKRWIKFANNFPVVPVDDIAIHPRENDLIFGTHGRSIWILDDITPLSQLTKEVLATPSYLFDIRPATIFNPFSMRNNYDFKGVYGHNFFIAPNPPLGAIISYYLLEEAKEDVKIVIQGSSGQIYCELAGPKAAGINRITWDLKYGPPAFFEEGEIGLRPFVLPGSYNVILKYGDSEMTKKVLVEGDPSVHIPFEDREAQHDALLSIYALNPALSASIKATDNLLRQIDILKKGLRETADVPKVISAIPYDITEKIGKIREQLLGNQKLGGASGRFSIRGQLRSLSISIASYSERPSPTLIEKIRINSDKLNEVVAKINKIIEEDIPNLNKLLNDKNIPRLFPGKIIKYSVNN